MPRIFVDCPLVELPEWGTRIQPARRHQVREEISRICRTRLETALAERMRPSGVEISVGSMPTQSVVLVTLDAPWPEDWVDSARGLQTVPIDGQMRSRDEFTAIANADWSTIVSGILSNPPQDVFERAYDTLGGVHEPDQRS